MFSYFIVLSVIALSSVYSNPLPQSYADTGREFKLAKPSSDVDMSYWQDLATKTAIITAKCGSGNFAARCCNSKLVDAHASRLQQPLNLYGQVMDSVGILDCGGNCMFSMKSSSKMPLNLNQTA